MLRFLNFYATRGYLVGIAIMTIAISFAPIPLSDKAFGVLAGFGVTLAAASFHYVRLRRHERDADDQTPTDPSR